MTNILLVGALGRLGTAISEYVSNSDKHQIIAGLDINKNNIKNNIKYNIYININELIDNNIKSDVVIDFSAPQALDSTLDYCLKTASPLVLGTTGLDEKQKEKIFSTSKSLPIFWSANMSLGIKILENICNNIIELSDNIFDIDIIEKHHSKKLDSPSGTAKMIAQSIKSKSDRLYKTNKIIFDNNNNNLNKTRDKDEIRIFSIRAGNITGQHSVLFNSEDEILTVSHVCNSKKVFARGAIKAADFIINKKSGLYNNIF